MWRIFIRLGGGTGESRGHFQLCVYRLKMFSLLDVTILILLAQMKYKISFNFNENCKGKWNFLATRVKKNKKVALINFYHKIFRKFIDISKNWLHAHTICHHFYWSTLPPLGFVGWRSGVMNLINSDLFSIC